MSLPICFLIDAAANIPWPRAVICRAGLNRGSQGPPVRTIYTRLSTSCCASNEARCRNTASFLISASITEGKILPVLITKSLVQALEVRSIREVFSSQITVPLLAKRVGSCDRSTAFQCPSFEGYISVLSYSCTLPRPSPRFSLY